ncbi:MAG: segregation/condensation protein A [Elusimicrobia bacterium]|nr:segregation/condensation protein A [Elusimicrobiota bacterium]
MNIINAMDVHLDVFEGPLDLLMYLIKKDNLDIYDIPISQITQEYLAYLEVMKNLNLEVAGEFLVMASTLMQVKSRMLLPSRAEPGSEEGPDPRGRLVSMLEDYQRYKQASKTLEGRNALFRDVFYRGSPVFSNDEKFLELEFFTLLDAVRRAFERVDDSQEVRADSFPIESRVEKIMDLLKSREWVLLDEIFASETKRLGIITCFIALLELIKQRAIMVVQDVVCGEVRIYHSPEPGDNRVEGRG